MRKKSDQDFKIAWSKYPFIRILIPFFFGILLVDFIPFQATAVALITGLTLMSMIIIHYTSRHLDQGPYWFGVVSFFFWISFSFLWTSLNDERNLPHHFLSNQPTELVTRTYYLEEKERFWDCYSEVLAQIDSSGTHPVNGNVLIRISKSYRYTPGKGDWYQGIFTLRVADGPSAPYEFDWNTLLHRRNIHQLAYLDTTSFKIIHHGDPGWVDRSGAALDDAIRHMIPDARDYPVASAMLIGLRKKMDPELYRAYTATGAVHVLSVSGMHVGILASILELCFGFIRSRSKAIRILKPIAMVILIWVYTFITGASPSILRSALMFTCFILAKHIQRDAAPMNILAGTAFVLLFLNPQDMYNIGFQLSFGAMAGIFLLYEPIRQLVTVTNKYLQTLWKLISVAMAAQLMIYPVVGYHFHQFAFYFWLTSLLSSPFSFVILVSGMIALPLYFLHISWLKLFYYPLIYSVKWMNDSIAWVYTLPLGSMQGWWPSIPECILLITVSLATGHFLYTKSITFLRLALKGLILFMIMMIAEEISDQQRTELIATYNRGNPKIWLKNKMSLIQLIGDSALANSNYAEKYNLGSAHIIRLDTNGIQYRTSSIHSSSRVLSIGNKRYQWITKPADGMQNDSIQNLLFLPRYWKLPDKIKIPATVYLPATTPVELAKKIFPQSQLKVSNSNYIQIPLR